MDTPQKPDEAITARPSQGAPPDGITAQPAMPIRLPPLGVAQPDWAIQYVGASLRVGITVPEIQKRLVGKGLSPQAATALVTSVLENRVRGQLQPLDDEERAQRLHRLLSAVVGGACLLLGYCYGGAFSALIVATWILLPLVCIWTSGSLIRLAAWVVLVLVFCWRLVWLAIQGPWA